MDEELFSNVFVLDEEDGSAVKRAFLAHDGEALAALLVLLGIDVTQGVQLYLNRGIVTVIAGAKDGALNG